MPTPIYEQQISNLKVRFEFLPERLRYSVSDEKGHRSAFAAYEWIDVFSPGFSKRRAAAPMSFFLTAVALLAGA